jgi:hypothetical protein
MLTGHVL